MKLSAIIVLVACLQASANSYAQNITLSEKNTSLEKIFRLIEKQTDYVFFFDHKLLDKSQKVSIFLAGSPLKKALDECLKDQPLTWSIVGKNIVIREKTVNAPWLPGAQEASAAIAVTGKVTGESGEGLPGASVMVKGTSQGTVTNESGEFKIDVPAGTVLVVSYIGYASQEVTVSSASATLNIVLKPSANTQDEIVVVGYGTVKKKDLTGAISQVGSKEVNAFPVTNVMQALSGRASGVRVMQNNGSPGAPMSVRIRGTNSIKGGNEPLYVIDGFPYNGNPTFLQNADIESIDILKDASSTAIYGSRGANGIVMITTRSGKKNAPTTVDFDAGYTIQSVAKKMDLMNAREYALFYNERSRNDNQAEYFTQAMIDSLSGNKGTDWQDLILRKAPMFTASVSVNGGSDKTRFSLGGNVFSQQGIVKNSDYNRYNLRASIDHDISKVFSVSASTILTRLNSRRQNSSLGNRGSDLISAMLMAPASLTPYLADGSYRRLNVAYPFISNAIINPLVPLNEVADNIKSDRVFTNAALTIKPFKGLSIRITGGIDNINDRTDVYSNREPSTNSVGNASVNTSQASNYLNENIATYTNTFGKHTITGMGAFSYQAWESSSLSGSGNGFLSDVLNTGNLGGATTPGIPGSSFSKTVLVSYLGRLNYTYDDKYLLTLSYRRDGYSAYSNESKWGTFPSAAVAWRLSNEEFMKGNGIFSDLKVRASYGVMGSNAISAYQTLNQLFSSNTIFGDALVTAFAPGSNLPNDLKWETTYQADAGVDMAFLGGRLRFTADYYRKITKDLLNDVQLPSSTGYRTTVQNVGEVENKGFEFAVDGEILNTNDVKWNVGANIAFNRNKVLKLYNGQDIPGRSLYTGALNDQVNLLREGEPMGIFYGYVETGYTETGNLQYEDRSKDGLISAADKTIIGDPNPDFIYGLNTSASWKGLELTLFIQGSQGNDIFNLNKAASLDLGMGLNLPREVYYNHWTPDNRNAAYPKLTSTLSQNMSTRFVEDGSYLRFRTIQLAYNLPVKNVNMKLFRSAQVYVSGQNLITFTKYSWYDPEVNAYGGASSIDQGIDYATYPTNKSVTFGIRCGF